MSLPNAVTKRVTPTEADHSKDTILNMLAEGAFYAFITLRQADPETEGGEGIVVAIQTDIGDAEILRIVLESAQEQVGVLTDE